MELNNINRSYKMAINDDSYINYVDNKLLFEGKANRVFYDSIMKRIKLAYKGRINGDNLYTEYKYDGSKYTPIGTSMSSDDFKGALKDLISNNDMHKTSSEIFSKLALNEGLLWTCAEGTEDACEELVEDYDVEAMSKSMIKNLDYAGALLVKYIEAGEEQYVDYVSVCNYFPIFSRYSLCKVVGYVEYQCVDTDNDIFLFTVHEEFRKELFFGRFNKTECEIEIVEANEKLLNAVGFEVEDLGEFAIEGWEVKEVLIDRDRGRAYGDSNYSEASKTNIRDWIVIDTAEGQSIDTFLRPKIIADEGFFERTRDDEGRMVLDLTQDVIRWSQGGTEKPFFETVKNEYNFEGGKSVKEQKELAIYRSLNYNETATGTGEKGYNSISGKMIDLIVPIQRATELFNAVKKGLEFACNKILEKRGIQAELTFKMGSPLTLTQKEKIENTGLEVENKLKSNVEAIADYRGISMEEAEEKYKTIEEESKVPIFTETDM
jgi:hypothetical protein